MINLFKKKEKTENKVEKKETKNNKQISQKEANMKINRVANKKGGTSIINIFDEIIANNLLKDAIIDDEGELSPEEVSLGYDKVTTKEGIIKCYICDDLPVWMDRQLLGRIRDYTLSNSLDVKLNYYVRTTPHTINWETKNMQRIRKKWGRSVANSEVDPNNVFTLRDDYGQINLLKNRMLTMQYYNDADQKYHRSTHKVSVYFELIGKRNDLVDLEQTVIAFKKACSLYGVKIVPIKTDVYQWNKSKFPTSLKVEDIVEKDTYERVMTDDNIANMLSIGQGRIGHDGIPIGIDVESGLIVLKKLREDEDAAENILITGGTGSGKSVFVKNILTWSLLEMTVMVLDFEGDEYKNLGNWLSDVDESWVTIVDMSKGNNNYFEPLRIAELTGDSEIDDSAREDAIDYTMSVFKLLLGIGEVNDSTSMKKEQIISECIKNVYLQHGVTEDKTTWQKSKTLRIGMVYKELVANISRQIWKDVDDTRKHDLAIDIRDILKRYFVPGEADYGIFGNPLNIEEIRNAHLIIFSFGNKGAAANANDLKMQLKQLSVANMSAQIANYCKTIKKQFNIQVWEEFQRWIDIPGSQKLITNVITGSRKRGTINFILTNDLKSLLEEKRLSAIQGNLQGYCVGSISDEETRHSFCEKFGMELMEKELKLIYEENKKSAGGKYNKAFACMFPAIVKTNTPETKCIVKAAIHEAVFDNDIFGGGVEKIKKANAEREAAKKEENEEEV